MISTPSLSFVYQVPKPNLNVKSFKMLLVLITKDNINLELLLAQMKHYLCISYSSLNIFTFTKSNIWWVYDDGLFSFKCCCCYSFVFNPSLSWSSWRVGGERTDCTLHYVSYNIIHWVCVYASCYLIIF